MTFEQIQGNDALKQALAGMVDSGKIPHAIMLHENDGGGAVAVALAFLQYLYRSEKVSKLIHPDIHFVFPVTAGVTSNAYISQWRELVASNPYFTEEQLNEALGIETKSTMIAVLQAKEIIENLSLSSLEGGYRTVVVYLPEKFNTEAANRLLKSIEEPSPETLFLMITHAPDKVLKTIASRCQTLRVLPPKGTGLHNDVYDSLFGKLMDALCAKDLFSALECADDIASLPSRENAKAFCRYASEKLRGIFLLQQKLETLSSDTTPEQSAWAKSLNKTFPRTALAVFGRAQSLIERNVNMQIIFTDLADRLSASV